ncbi:urease accessory protein UreD [Corynebacterium sp. 320]|uniref:urease accessory protein UreD n=1 Tax=Corynebacterium TaxID=1716 RepID=UPI00125CAF05|nr:MULTISPECIES: urease accessory protein UreD [Corynebacterium]KAB1504449.1 urease accessory protein UreD [Corynebacterium sp. 320]KAB1552452.1 urease accessory protein UreD [Corynebacterium sp. 321]KAB1554333.1 urease accessory protein UreD [Corynebacterium sp. 319]KAB3528585.1 urease accessory protein UreD [Corynebacterium sp. 250]KAB3539923.1 urease accessory protein UreD [Corynebacterium sp. 366]
MAVTVPELQRTNARALTPPVPYEFRAYDNPAAGDGVQAVGRPGKLGVIDLELVRGTTGKTGMARRYVKAPMSLSRPLHVDPQDPHTAVVYLRSTGGGIAQNDRIRQRFVLQPNATALITTQAATSVHRMNSGFGSQWTSAVVADAAMLEYLPGHTTLFGGSRFLQLTEFDLHPHAALIAGEVVMMGRVASGEIHKFDACSITLRVTRERRILLNDRMTALREHNNANTQLFGEWPVWATLVVVPPERPSVDVAVLVDELHELGQRLAGNAVVGGTHTPPLAVGVSSLVDNAGALVRIAGTTMEHVRRTMDALHSAARQRLCGKPSFDLRTM